MATGRRDLRRHCLSSADSEVPFTWISDRGERLLQSAQQVSSAQPLRPEQTFYFLKLSGSDTMPQPLASLAREVAELLQRTGNRVVFAESCTAGLVSATLGRVPGISDFHCGSAVVYRLDTKAKWLGISEALLKDPGPVSSEVAEAMARGVLGKTPEANLAASITGHLGPNAPDGQDGLVYIAIVERGASVSDITTFRRILPNEITCLTETGAESLREWRQWKAAELVLTFTRDHLARLGGTGS